jgi:hypothetical protein
MVPMVRSLKPDFIRDVHSIPVECLAVLPALSRLGEGADINPIIYRHLEIQIFQAPFAPHPQLIATGRNELPAHAAFLVIRAHAFR